MEPTTPSPDPAAVTPQQSDVTSTRLTSRPADDPRWASPPVPPNVGASSALPVMVVATIGMLGVCLLGALLGSWVLVMVGLIAAVLAFHYFAWGWVYTRLVSAQQKEELLRLAREDEPRLPDPVRSRHV